MESPSSVDFSDENILCTLLVQLTVFHRLSWSCSDVFCMEWRCACALDIILWLFFSHFFCFVNLVFFSVWNAIKVYRQWLPCGCNSSYSFVLIVLKHCRCFQHGMNLRCACGFGIILWLFFSLFLLCELSLFFTWNAIKVYRQWVPCLTVFLQLFWNFTDVFGMEWRCTCGLGITLFFSLFLLKNVGAILDLHCPSVILSFRLSVNLS